MSKARINWLRVPGASFDSEATCPLPDTVQRIWNDFEWRKWLRYSETHGALSRITPGELREALLCEDCETRIAGASEAPNFTLCPNCTVMMAGFDAISLRPGDADLDRYFLARLPDRFFAKAN